jgi:hypothetical protein
MQKDTKHWATEWQNHVPTVAKLWSERDMLTAYCNLGMNTTVKSIVIENV